jgi:hypothetical protein
MSAAAQKGANIIGFLGTVLKQPHRRGRSETLYKSFYTRINDAQQALGFAARVIQPVRAPTLYCLRHVVGSPIVSRQGLGLVTEAGQLLLNVANAAFNVPVDVVRIHAYRLRMARGSAHRPV